MPALLLLHPDVQHPSEMGVEKLITDKVQDLKLLLLSSA